MLSRRVFCFKSNMESLVVNSKTYLWTFTMREAVDYETLRKEWNKLLTYLRRRLPEWCGIRVYEVHPGKWGEFSHGLHVHVVTNKFQDIKLVIEAAKAAGFGRVHVVRRRGTMGHYLAKYLSKPRPDALKGWRLWACFNMPDRSRMADVVIESPRARLMRYGFASGHFEGLSWASKLRLLATWAWQEAAGLPLSIFHDKRVDRWSAFMALRPPSYRFRSLPFAPARPLPVLLQPSQFSVCWGEDLTLSDRRRMRGL